MVLGGLRGLLVKCSVGHVGRESFRMTHCQLWIHVVLLLWSGAPLSICEAANEARQNRKRWGNPATILLDNGNEAWSACKDAVSGKLIVFTDLFLIDSYDEAYLRAMCLDFKSTASSV